MDKMGPLARTKAKSDVFASSNNNNKQQQQQKKKKT